LNLTTNFTTLSAFVGVFSAPNTLISFRWQKQASEVYQHNFLAERQEL